MQVQPECVICLFRLALRAARAATSEATLHREVLNRLAQEIPLVPADAISPQVGRRVQQIVHDVTGVADPFRNERARSNAAALSHYPRLESRVRRAPKPLLEAIRLAVAGNVIDLAVGSDYDLDRAIEESLELEFAIFDYDRLERTLERAERVLYVADNAGEIVFDRLLVEQLSVRGLDVTVAVRGGPAINDALFEDARQAGLIGRAGVIDTGTDLPSVLLGEAGKTFREHYRRADLLISKGQGNFEGLCDERGPIAFLLRAKCVPVARRLGVRPGDLVLHYRHTG